MILKMIINILLWKYNVDEAEIDHGIDNFQFIRSSQMIVRKGVNI